MNKCYTIASLDDAIKYSLDTVQITMNGRMFPSKRDYNTILKNFNEKCKVPVILHYDFIYIISRYSMFADSVRKAIQTEIRSLLENPVDNLVGIVMHTDYPLKKCMDKSMSVASVNALYPSQVWDPVHICDAMQKPNIVEESILQFANDLEYTPKLKIYLENTTKVGKDNINLEFLVNLFKKYPRLSKVFGLCYDTEHHFANTGEILSIADVKHLRDSLGIEVMVHLNTIPEAVKPKSNLDRHSETTIYECSRNTDAWYKKYAEALTAENILWVREVVTETMERELENI